MNPINRQMRTAADMVERMKRKVNRANFRKPPWRQNHDQ